MDLTTGSRIDCPFCETTIAIENTSNESCWACQRKIVADGQLIDEESVFGRPEDTL